MTVALAICLSQVSAASGAAPTSQPAALTAASEHCLSARKAVAYYRAHTHERQSARGGELADRAPVVRGKSCHWARYAAGVWVARAKAALKALRAWEHEYAWWRWLPATWKAIIQCETGSNFRHSNSTHQGAFGFAISSWDDFKRPGYPAEAYLATPRQQYEVALAIWRRYRFTGWGCA